MDIYMDKYMYKQTNSYNSYSRNRCNKTCFLCAGEEMSAIIAFKRHFAQRHLQSKICVRFI